MNFTNLGNFFAGIGNRFLALIIPSVKAALADVVEIATKAVLLEAGKTISGKEKFSNAVQNVLKTVSASGKVVAKSTVEVAVQAAYEAVLGKK